MADGKKERKYYWLKLPRNFFSKHYILMLMAEPQGKELVLFYIRLLTESIDHEGQLRYSESIPYTPESLAALTGFPLHTVTEALRLFAEMELVATEADGTLLLPKCLEMIGSESESTQRVRDYRKRKKEEQERAGNAAQKPPERPKQEKPKKSEGGKKEPPALPYKEVVDYLNQKVGSKYKHTTKSTQRIISGRFKEGFTLDDFKAVIDTKAAQWMGDKKMAAFLRPETLFAASHFESYLNEAGQRVPAERKHPGISERLAAETDNSLAEGDFGEFN